MSINHYRENDKSLERYLEEIGKVPLITPEKEVELTGRIKDGELVALHELTRANLRFVVSIANKYKNQGLTMGDLINEGNMGLIEAAKRFDETRGFKFISYAVWWIRQSIIQAISEQSRTVRLPLNRIGHINKISKAYKNLEQKYSREPNRKEIAKALNMTSDEVSEHLKISKKELSLDCPIRQPGWNKLIDFIPAANQPLPDNQLLKESLRFDIGRAIGKLSEKESEIIQLYFGLGYNRQHNLEEIGLKFNLSRERIRQIKEKAIKKLQHVSHIRILREYLV